jgi:hypothetical protein
MQWPEDRRSDQGAIGCPHTDVRPRTGLRPQHQVAGYISKTNPEVSMLLAVAAVLLIIAVIGGIPSTRFCS